MIELLDKRLRRAIEWWRNRGASKRAILGRCGWCGGVVYGGSRWWTGSPGRSGTQPLHDGCARRVLFRV